MPLDMTGERMTRMPSYRCADLLFRAGAVVHPAAVSANERTGPHRGQSFHRLVHDDRYTLPFTGGGEDEDRGGVTSMNGGEETERTGGLCG